MPLDCDERSLTSQRYIDSNISEIMANEKINHPSSLNRPDPLRGSKNNIDEGSSDFEQEESVDVMSQASSNSGSQEFMKTNNLEIR